MGSQSTHDADGPADSRDVVVEGAEQQQPDCFKFGLIAIGARRDRRAEQECDESGADEREIDEQSDGRTIPLAASADAELGGWQLARTVRS